MSEANATVQTANVHATYDAFCVHLAVLPWWHTTPDNDRQLLYACYRTDANTTCSNPMGLEEWADLDGSTPYADVAVWLEECAACTVPDGTDLATHTVAFLDAVDQWVKDHADQFGSTAPVQSTAPQTPEQVASDIAMQQAAEQAAREGHLAAAQKALLQSANCIRRAERGLATSMLQAGKFGYSYLYHHVAAGASRDSGITALQGRWAEYGEDTKANVVIPCYHAYRLLQEEPGLKVEVAYHLWRDYWRQLVERSMVTMDVGGGRTVKQEQWALLPGLEQECKAEFARVAGLGKPDKQAASAAVRALVERHESLKADAAKLAAAAKQAADTAAKAELDKARIAEAKAEQDAKAAKQAAEQAKDAEKAELTRQAEDAKERLRQSQAELVAKHAAATAATAEKDRADKAAAEAERLRQVAADKALKAAKAADGANKPDANKPAGATARPGVEQPACKAPAVDMAAIGKAGSPADAAKMAEEFLLANEDNEGAVLHLLAGLRHKLSAKFDAGLEAFEAAYTAFKAPSKPGSKPVQLTDAEKARIAAHNAKLATARAG